MKRCEIFLDFAMEKDPAHKAWYEQALTFDLYARENMKRRPAWAPDLSSMKKVQMQYLREHGLEKNYCHMEPFDKEFLIKFTDMDTEEYRRDVLVTDGEDPAGIFPETVAWVLFDYEHRDALTGDAVCHIVDFSNILPV